MLLFISGGEIFIILLVVIMLFGADKLPEIARELGKVMRIVKNATNDVKREIRDSAQKNDIDIDVASKVKKEINRVKDNFEDFTKPIEKKVQDQIDDITGPVKRNK